MTDAETRVLARTAAVLLVASVARYAWEARRPGPPPLETGGEEGPALLAESRRLASENERRARALGPDERLDPNRASAVELDRLPGVGPAVARAIVAARERDGPYRSVEDLGGVPGIGPGTLARMRDKLEIAGQPVRRAAGSGAVPAPVASPAPPRAPAPSRTAPAAPRDPLDLNRVGAAELERLPGIGPALAARILEERTRRGGFGAPEDLLRVRGIGPATLERLRPLVRVGGR